MTLGAYVFCIYFRCGYDTEKAEERLRSIGSVLSERFRVQFNKEDEELRRQYYEVS